MKITALLLSAISILSLNGCGSVDRFMEKMGAIDIESAHIQHEKPTDFLEVINCPPANIYKELDSISNFKDFSNKDVLSEVNITNVETSCELDKSGVTINIRVKFQGQSYAYNDSKMTTSYPYFIAVISPEGKILDKDKYYTVFNYDNDKKALYENIHKYIPLINNQQSGKYKIFIGFQLSKEQLEYNRTKSQENLFNIDPSYLFDN